MSDEEEKDAISAYNRLCEQLDRALTGLSVEAALSLVSMLEKRLEKERENIADYGYDE